MATRDELQARLNKYLTAEEAILGGAQSFTAGDTVFTRANLPALQQQIEKLEARLACLNGRLHGQAVFGGRR